MTKTYAQLKAEMDALLLVLVPVAIDIRPVSTWNDGLPVDIGWIGVKMETPQTMAQIFKILGALGIHAWSFFDLNTSRSIITVFMNVKPPPKNVTYLPSTVTKVKLIP